MVVLKALAVLSLGAVCSLDVNAQVETPSEAAEPQDDFLSSKKIPQVFLEITEELNEAEGKSAQDAPGPEQDGDSDLAVADAALPVLPLLFDEAYLKDLGSEVAALMNNFSDTENADAKVSGAAFDSILKNVASGVNELLAAEGSAAAQPEQELTDALSESITGLVEELGKDKQFKEVLPALLPVLGVGKEFPLFPQDGVNQQEAAENENETGGTTPENTQAAAAEEEAAEQSNAPDDEEQDAETLEEAGAAAPVAAEAEQLPEEAVADPATEEEEVELEEEALESPEEEEAEQPEEPASPVEEVAAEESSAAFEEQNVAAEPSALEAAEREEAEAGADAALSGEQAEKQQKRSLRSAGNEDPLKTFANFNGINSNSAGILNATNGEEKKDAENAQPSGVYAPSAGFPTLLAVGAVVATLFF